MPESETRGKGLERDLPPANGDGSRVGASASDSGQRGGGSGSGSKPAHGGDPSGLPQPGDRLEFFEVHAPVGSGGMGAVFLATDLRLDRQVALKILPPEQASDPETVHRFYHEGRAAARLDHENIARVYTLGQDRGLHYIAYEYVDGTTLRQMVEQRGVLSSAETVDIGLQIANALVHAAGRMVVHRDIKPSNIIVTPEGRAKLVDMGLARRFERDRKDRGLTQSGMTLGTFDYISPEQARDPRNVDVRSDLYSLGCTMYHMLTGQPPFPEGTVLQKLLQHQEEPAPDPRALNPDVPDGLAAIVLKLMEKDRDRRFQTPESLRVALREMALSLGLKLGPHESAAAFVESREPAGWDRHLAWALPLLAFALILTGLYVWRPVGDSRPADSAARERVSTPRPTPPRVTTAKPDEPGAGIAETITPRSVEPILVGSNQDLGAVLARAPGGATIVLTDPGPYRMRLVEVETAPGAGVAPRHLTIRGTDRVTPVVRAELGGTETRGLRALIWLKQGSLRLEGIEFDLGGASMEQSVCALALDDVDAEVTNCVFRGATSGVDGNATVAIVTRSSAHQAITQPLRLLGCVFLGRQAGVRALGPADLDLRNCQAAVSGSLIWAEGRESEKSPVDVRLSEARVVASDDAPVFRFERVAPRVVVEQSWIGAAGVTEGTLVTLRDSEPLRWRGRGNVYGRLSRYLSRASSNGELEVVRDFNRWAEAEGSTREMRSEARDERLWVLMDPIAESERARVEIAGLFARTRAAGASPGEGDSGGPLDRISDMLGGLMRSARDTRGRREDLVSLDPRESKSIRQPAALPERSGAEGARAEPDTKNPTPGESRGAGAVVASAGSPPTAPVPTMPPMPENPSAPMIQTPMMPDDDSPVNTSASVSSPPVVVAGGAASVHNATAGTADARSLVDASEAVPSRVTNEDEWRRALTRMHPQGGTIRLANQARLKIQALEVPRGGRWTIEGVPGSSRALLQFEANDSAGREAEPVFRLSAGAVLELRELDIVVKGAALAEGSSAEVFRMEPGADLSLSRCTVTLVPGGTDAGSGGWVVARIARDRDPAGEAPTALVRVEDSFIRGGGDVIDIGARRRIDLTLANSAVVTSGSLLAARGAARGVASDTHKLSIRQSTIRAAGGLVRLSSSAAESQLPQVDIVARDTILATTQRGAPLLRIQSQDDADDARNRISWEGHGVVYHMIDVYRLHDPAQAGASPVPFRRLSWDVAVGPREDTPFHGDARWARPWRDDQRAWTASRDDVRLAFDSPVSLAGPRLDRLPEPPPLD